MHRVESTRDDSTHRHNTSLVLLVDADQTRRFSYRSVLSHHGFDVVTATDGATGLQVCNASPPDWIIIDIDPPTCPSLDVVQLLARHPRFHGATIAMTRRGVAYERRTLGALRLHAILVKPVDPKTLVTTVGNVFGTDD